MQIKNLIRWSKAGPEPYLAGLGGFAIALAVRYLLQPWLDDHLPMLFFALNCIVIAYFYGFWPSILMLLLSIPSALFFFVKPFYSFGILSDTDLFIFVVYSTLIGLTACMFEALRREQYKSALLIRVSDTRYRLLVEADEDRRIAIKKQQAPQA